MQQLSRVCMIADHEQRQIEYYCMYPECTLSRFVCSKCLKIGNHKHSQQDQSHILDNQELYKVLQEKLNKKQYSILQTQNQGVKFQAEGLQKLIKECKTLFNSIRVMIEQMEIFIDQNYNNGLEANQLLQRLKKNGFNYIDNIQLNILMNIGKKTDIFTQLSEQSNEIIQNVSRIQEWCNSQQSLLKSLYFNKYKSIIQDTGEDRILSSAISNDLKYIVGGGIRNILKIWNYSNNQLIKTIQLDDYIHMMKFTDDSKFLYVGIFQYLYQFHVDNNFKQTYKQDMHLHRFFSQIICITNTIVLVSTTDNTITKTDIILKKQMLNIQAHQGFTLGLDYNNDLNKIASSGSEKYIKIWNGNNGQLVLQKSINYEQYKILFMLNGKQLICQQQFKIIIYNINYETKQLEEYQQIIESRDICNISLVLNQQYISLVCREYIKIYSIKGNLIRQFNHGVADLYDFDQLQFDPFPEIIQPPSIQAFIILGKANLYIFKQEID